MKSILTILLILVSFSVSAQFDINSGVETGNTIKIADKTYPILETTKGSPFIVCESPKTNNKYAVWIGKETSKTYEGQSVRLSNSGKYFIFIVSPKSKNPYCKYLKEEQIL